jgi:hypothetical protein
MTAESIGIGMLRRAGYGDHGERIDDAALREAQQAKDAVRAYELVYRGGE